MLNFQLLPGDKYDGRCAEIYITEKQFLIYHCSVCEEIYATFNELLSHITKDHYENTKEYIEEVVEVEEEKVNDEDDNVLVVEEGKSVENNTTHEENQLNIKEFKSKTQFEVNFVIKNITIEHTKENEAINHQCNEEILTKVDLPAACEVSNKHSPQRKKPRLLAGMLKNYAIARNKTNSLTRFHVNSQEERKYVCGICGFAFKEKYNLRGHLLRHSNQKNFSCSQCPKRFFTKVELRLHEYRHKGGERSYLCNHCGMGFVSSSSLMQHLKKQHSLNHTLKCQQCTKTFNNFDLLKIHQLVHFEQDSVKCGDGLEDTKKILKDCSDVVEFGCENCDLVFNSDKALKEHFNAKTICKEKDKQVLLDDISAEDVIEEGVLALEENFDEYELVQTLTDLECKKTC